MIKGSKQKYHDEEGDEKSESSLILSLSLFIMLLAFFIVLNGISDFSEPKVSQAFNSIDLTFSTNILDPELDFESLDERVENQNGSGDSVDELEGVLRSILPNLKMNVQSDPNGGSDMLIRMRKGQFEKLSNVMIPLFSRVLMEKDQTLSYGIVLTSYVRDPMAEGAVKSFQFIERYTQELIEAGLPRHRISVAVEKGNPSMLSIGFSPIEGR